MYHISVVKLKNSLFPLTLSSRILANWKKNNYDNCVHSHKSQWPRKGYEQKWIKQSIEILAQKWPLPLAACINNVFLLLQVNLCQAKKKNSCPSWTILIYRYVLCNCYVVQCCFTKIIRSCMLKLWYCFGERKSVTGFLPKVNNPVSVLTQEMSKYFLHSKGEGDKYKVVKYEWIFLNENVFYVVFVNYGWCRCSCPLPSSFLWKLRNWTRWERTLFTSKPPNISQRIKLNNIVK